jgi:outer membrane protein assembly factor BamD
MKFYSKVIIIIFCFILHSCSGKDKKISIVEEKDVELQMIESFKKGYESLEDGDVLFAAKNFNEAELLYPQSKWAPKAALMAAYAYYSQNYYTDTIYELERFIKIYPNNEDISYAHFLLAMCFYENIVDEKKDLEPLIKARNKFEFIIEKYPDSDFALDASFKIGLIRDLEASKEMYLARHYIKKEKWVAAINRYQTVVEDYDTTIYVEEALHRLVEIYFRIGLKEESMKYANVLGYNYQSSLWYEKSYVVFNRDYKTREKKRKEKSNFIVKKFKSLLE